MYTYKRIKGFFPESNQNKKLSLTGRPFKMFRISCVQRDNWIIYMHVYSVTNSLSEPLCRVGRYFTWFCNKRIQRFLDQAGKCKSKVKWIDGNINFEYWKSWQNICPIFFDILCCFCLAESWKNQWIKSPIICYKGKVWFPSKEKKGNLVLKPEAFFEFYYVC